MVYANGNTELWMNETQLQAEAKVQLNSVKINQYGTFLSDLNKLADSGSINKIWISPDASQAIFSRIPSGKLLVGSKFKRRSSSVIFSSIFLIQAHQLKQQKQLKIQLSKKVSMIVEFEMVLHVLNT